ncbi:hypothetical protein EW026_g2696 [Hermanssonia centrifuga]|uniref:Carboxypeptidase n=1 Tax=Hermanssonia centrifuga TaxID=98765 RepID=A0A4S4KPD2_9APHY|nr:hypothetical protein EW026_g2696 [Hermanssonia centrifuga]
MHLFDPFRPGRIGFVLLASLGVVINAVTLPNDLSSRATFDPTILTFKSEVHTDVSLRFVRNSGVCETTPGVNQLSGYIDFGTNMSMWFWFFEAREKPETAPFTLWLNGGPGCSSMIGLFQENGPCKVDADGHTTILNPFSWNNISNIIYIDQPIGTGLSHGVIDVNSTFAAAPPFWTAFQVLLESQEFHKFESREFVLATESYGGHYGPEFVTFFDEQNAQIEKGAIQGEKTTVSALMINNDEVIAALNQAFFGPGGCQEQEMACFAAEEDADSNSICGTADDFCIENVFVPAVGNRDSDDLRQNSSALFPPEFYVNLLQFEQTLGLSQTFQVTYRECAGSVDDQFSRTGDDARTLLPQLASLVNSGLKTLIWAGDADINCNWLGGHASVLAMDWFGNETLHHTPFTNMTIRGDAVAAIQNVDNFSFA